MLSVQPGLRSSNDLRVGRKMTTFQFFFQSREQVVVRRGQIRRIWWVIKTLEAQLGQFLLGCKCPVSRGIVVQEQDPLLLKSRASPDMIPFSLCNKKKTCNSAHEQNPLSNDTIDSVLRHREVDRAKNLSAPPRVCNVTLRGVRATVVTVEMQQVLHILSVCL